MPEMDHLKRLAWEIVSVWMSFWHSLRYTFSLHASYFACFEKLMGSLIILRVQVEKGGSLQLFHRTQSKLSTDACRTAAVLQERADRNGEVESVTIETAAQEHLSSMEKKDHCTDIYGLKGICLLNLWPHQSSKLGCTMTTANCDWGLHCTTLQHLHRENTWLPLCNESHIIWTNTANMNIILSVNV